MNNEEYITKLREAINWYKDSILPSQNELLILDVAKSYADLLESQTHKILPVEPDGEMIRSFVHSCEANATEWGIKFKGFEDGYKAMLSAAPPYNPGERE